MPAPVLFFAFKRPDETKAALDALQANHLAPESELYIFADAARKPAEEQKAAQTRQVLDEARGFRSIHRDYAETNIGCANSIIRGVSRVLAEYPAAIIVEDDLITAPNFLDFMNQGLRQYVHNPTVYSVSGYTMPFPRPAGYASDAYLIPRHSPWGWATWADRWASVNWDLPDYSDFAQDRQQKAAFRQGGSDLVGMLREQMEGRSDAWDIRFCYNRFKANALTVYPTASKVQNIGFGADATHTDIYNRYKTPLDEGTQRTFRFPDAARITDHYHQHTLRRYSVPTRIFNKLKTYAGMR